MIVKYKGLQKGSKVCCCLLKGDICEVRDIFKYRGELLFEAYLADLDPFSQHAYDRDFEIIAGG